MNKTKLQSEYPDLDKYIDKYGDIFYCKKNTTIIHNPYGPAIISHDGNKEYVIENQVHRLDGPAIISSYGEKKWYLNNKFISYDEKNFYDFIKTSITSKNWFYHLNFKDKKINRKDKIHILNIKNSLSHALDIDSINILKSLL